MFTKEKRTLLIGIDLSFNSTGICCSTLIDNKPYTIKFYRVVFEHRPKYIANVNQVVYKMPTNISVDDLLLSDNSKNDNEQMATTIRAMICSKKINKILAQVINDFKPDTVICTIENYIMPAFGGPNSLKTVSGLIMLQGFVREFLIRYKITFPEITMLLHTPTPSQNKKNFTNDGKADKDVMIQTFIDLHDGTKLLPNLNDTSDKSKLDDLVDAYSLLTYGWKIYLEKHGKDI